MSEPYAGEVASRFFSYVARTAEGEAGPVSLETELSLWIECGDAIELTGGDYGLLMLTVIFIMSRLQVDSTLTVETHARQPFFDLDEGLPDCLQRDRWDSLVFLHRHSRQ